MTSKVIIRVFSTRLSKAKTRSEDFNSLWILPEAHLNPLRKRGPFSNLASNNLSQI